MFASGDRAIIDDIVPCSTLCLRHVLTTHGPIAQYLTPRFFSTTVAGLPMGWSVVNQSHYEGVYDSRSKEYSYCFRSRVFIIMMHVPLTCIKEKRTCCARTPRVTIEQEHRRTRKGKKRRDSRHEQKRVCMASQDNNKIMRPRKENKVKDRNASDILFVLVVVRSKSQVRSWKCNAGYNAQGNEGIHKRQYTPRYF